jgi:signal transduction histidine kinase
VNTLAQFVREHKDLILSQWLAEVRQLPSAHSQSLEAIRDHIPDFLDRLADAIDCGDVSAVTMQGLPNLHAAMRVREGYDLRQVVAEYRSIRAVILRLYGEKGDVSEESRPKLLPIATMNAALDTAIADAVDQYAIDQGKAREMFIGMLGHDLRDPLNTIAFSARLLSNGGQQPEADTQRIATRIESSATRMDSMIRDLLDFARGRLGGVFPIVPTPADARTLLAETVTEISHGHPERSIALSATRHAEDFDVEWDPDRIAQALTNLLSNAVAHGGDPIVVDAKRDGEWITIEVRNAGEIPAAALPTIFAPFSAPATDRRHTNGAQAADRRRGHLGLGLYIVHEIAIAHGGKVVAESHSGDTIFRLVLPRIAPKNDSWTAPSKEHDSAEASRTSISESMTG